MFEAGPLSILPPLLAIGLAIWTRRVYLSLLAGIFIGWTILAAGNPIDGVLSTARSLAAVFADTDNRNVILFCGLVGAVVRLTRRSGGVDGFVARVTARGWLRDRRTAQFIAAGIGCLVFVETSISSLIVGSVARPIFDASRISREKLAYICDSTSAPVNLLIPLNAWGAFILGLLSRTGVSQPVPVLVSAVAFNFYSICALAMVFLVIGTGRDFSAMRRAEKRTAQAVQQATFSAAESDSGPGAAEQKVVPDPARASNLVVPVLVLILMMPVGLLATGGGNLLQGSGSTAVLLAVTVSLVVSAGLILKRRILSLKTVWETGIRGVGGMLPLMSLMVLAFAIGDVTRYLKTGPFIAGAVSGALSPALIPLVLFLAGCLVAFSTGTSWGTYAILVPIAVSTAGYAGLNLPLALAAVLGGGLFGDHCSPISDTTLIASMAASCDHIAHVRTQLPYALTAAFIAGWFYLVAGLLVHA